MFNPGGLWKADILLRGSIGTASVDPDAMKLMRLFGSAFRKNFANVRGNRVGPEAEKFWKQGKRLTGAEQSPPEFDLAPEAHI